jgi:hypothetical protein
VAATRDFTELTATLENTPAARVHVRLGYTWSHLQGNWSGPWDPAEGFPLYRNRLGANPDYATGWLSGDHPHRFFAEVASAPLRAFGFALDGSIRATASSGAPRSQRDDAATFLVQRGMAGRLPTVAQANLHLGARRGRVTITADIFNLFNRSGVTAVDEVYSFDARPIEGGTARDLIFLKNDPVLRHALNARYGQPIRVQAPLAVHLGVRVDL